MEFLTLAFVAQVLRISVPYVLAALGGLCSERGGVVNIALEGMLLIGAFAATLGSFYGQNVLLGVAAGVAGGITLAALHALCTVRFRADQIVCGVAVNLLAVGATRFFLKLCFDSSSNSPRVAGLALPSWAHGGQLAVFLGETAGNPLLLAAFGLALLGHFALFRTRFGLRLRAVGEHPEAALSLGVSVERLRWAGVLLSGALAGLGGAWLALEQHQFVDLMSNGRGFIAIAALIFGKWRPLPTSCACLLFGLAEALQLALQSSGAGVSSVLVQTLPYLLTLVTLAGVIGRATPPRALGVPFEKE